MEDLQAFIAGVKASGTTPELWGDADLFHFMKGEKKRQKRSEQRQKWEKQNGKPKGANKDKNKGNRKVLKETKEGKLICKFWYTSNGCRRDPCKFAHVCRFCGSADHKEC